MANDLAELRDRVEIQLRDTSNAIWTTTDLDDHIRHALQTVSLHAPQRLAKTVNCTATREYTISSSVATGVLEIQDVWYPYNATTPEHPPYKPCWKVINGTLYLETPNLPTTAEKMRVFYTLAQTLKDLDAALATTLDPATYRATVNLAAAYAALAYAAGTINTATASGWTPRQLLEWSQARLQAALDELRTLDSRDNARNDTRITWPLQ